MRFVVEVVPRSEEDARISIALDAADRLEALRGGLAEIGLDGRLAGAAAVEPLPDGGLAVRSEVGGFAFVVRPIEGTAAPEPGAATDDELLDESRLELYFADEEEPADEVVVDGGAGQPPSPPPAEVAPSAPGLDTWRGVTPAPPAGAGDDRTARLLGRLADLEEYVYDLGDALEFAAGAIRGPLAADVACVLLIDRRGRSLGFTGLSGDVPARLAKYAYPKGLGLPWLACDEGRPLLLNGLDRDAGLHREVLDKTGFRIRSTILAPIRSAERTWGVVQAVRNAPDACDFVDADLEVLEAVAGRLGTYLALFGTYL